ncbi:hypothetical protein [Mycobacterium bohemicum]|uniref:hypothetical protein n=1 Tax=Mycobacterium bohemicum TaxID=56425 RepID=UPI0011127C0A|nr:hypothetical protein [Mycobacterium bohemicum]MCV6970315.1 hypothetical protein [Mycobacterium bohemicum]
MRFAIPVRDKTKIAAGAAGAADRSWIAVSTPKANAMNQHSKYVAQKRVSAFQQSPVSRDLLEFRRFSLVFPRFANFAGDKSSATGPAALAVVPKNGSELRGCAEACLLGASP